MHRRSPAERARHIIMHERGVEDANAVLEMRGIEQPPEIPPLEPPVPTSTKKIVTTTVVVVVPPTSKTTSTPKQIVPPVTTASPTVHTTSSPLTTTTQSTSSTSSTTSVIVPPVVQTTPTTTPTLPTTTPRAIPPSSTPTTTPTVLPTNSPDVANSGAVKSGGLSPAATGAIVTVSVLAVLGIIIFILRKIYIRRRQRRRNTWGAGMFPASHPDQFGAPATQGGLPPSIPEKAPSPVTSPVASGFGVPFGSKRASRQTLNTTITPYYVSPPPQTYNNPIAEDVYGGIASGPSRDSFGSEKPAGSVGSFGNTAGAAAPQTAVVRVVYIPSLPDELSITVGEVVRVIKAFDDGWALCANARGDQGVVPLECLDMTVQSAPAVGYGQGAAGDDWKNARRLSSLSTQNPRY